VIYVEAGHYIAGDGEVIEGVASVDESAITGESAPVIREAGGDRSAVTGGTKVLSDWIKVRITSNPGETFLDRMIALVEGANPPEDAQRDRAQHPALRPHHRLPARRRHAAALRHLLQGPQTVFVLVSLLVCLIPTTIGGLLSAIGIAGMDRLVQYNVLAMSGRAVEAAGDVDTLLLDKTGTITLGNRQATEFIPRPTSAERERWPTPRSWPRSPTKPPRAAPSSCWPRRSTTCAAATSAASTPSSSLHRADPHERRRTCPARASARARSTPSPASWEEQGSQLPQEGPRAVVEEIAAPAARRWWSPRTPACWASFTSRTSSRAASRSASPACAPWASAPS
jgi:hypothetical protein